MDTSSAQSPIPYIEIARKVLGKYLLLAKDLVFVQHSENVTYQVVAPRKFYLLRIHKPLTKGMRDQRTSLEDIRSELRWVTSLRRKKMPVPRPVRNRSGGLVTKVLDSDRNSINCSVLEWLDGEVYTRDMETEDTVAQMGRLVGKIHHHASSWKIPRGFRRPIRNENYFTRVINSLLPAVDDGRITYHDYKTLQESIALLNVLTRGIRKTRKTVGLIHGDLHRGNFLLDGQEIQLIDFSLSAFGHFTYDLGTCLSNISPAFHPVFLENYEQFFTLPKDYERLIEGFFIANYVVIFSFWLENPDAQEALVQRVPYIAQQYASLFNRDERFWFNFVPNRYPE